MFRVAAVLLPLALGALSAPTLTDNAISESEACVDPNRCMSEALAPKGPLSTDSAMRQYNKLQPRADSNDTDVEVLNFALSLEHLESAFYTGGLAKFSAKDFTKAGYPAWVRGRFEQIAEHEATHVQFLMGALGSQAVQPCQYSFSHDTVQEFTSLSMVLETVGASAYLGGAKLIENKDYLTAAASILAVESRQASWVSSAVLKDQPWNGPFDAPLSPSGAYSLAAPFMINCTASPLVKTFPPLTLGMAETGSNSRMHAMFEKAADTSTNQTYVAWLDGLEVLYSEIDADSKTVVPDGLAGTVYATVVSEQAAPTDDNMLTGYTVVQFPFSSSA